MSIPVSALTNVRLPSGTVVDVYLQRWEVPPNTWTSLLGTAVNTVQLHLPSGQTLLITGATAPPISVAMRYFIPQQAFYDVGTYGCR